MVITIHNFKPQCIVETMMCINTVLTDYPVKQAEINMLMLGILLPQCTHRPFCCMLNLASFSLTNIFYFSPHLKGYFSVFIFHEVWGLIWDGLQKERSILNQQGERILHFPQCNSKSSLIKPLLPVKPPCLSNSTPLPQAVCCMFVVSGPCQNQRVFVIAKMS